jgi:hypothetical protein
LPFLSPTDIVDLMRLDFAAVSMIALTSCLSPRQSTPNSASATPATTEPGDTPAPAASSDPSKAQRPPPHVAEYIREHGLCTIQPPPQNAAVASSPRSGDAGALSIRSGEMTESGSLPPEVIQYIVRQTYQVFRGCYEAGLAKDPRLQGSVTTRFIIGSNGTVTEVIDAGSQMSADVISCIHHGFAGLCFPRPTEGIVTVVYPIMFSPGD